MRPNWMAVAGLALAGLAVAAWADAGAGLNHQATQERANLCLQSAQSTPGALIPPWDTVPAHAETATFALG
jgi:hypothetical protein